MIHYDFREIQSNWLKSFTIYGNLERHNMIRFFLINIHLFLLIGPQSYPSPVTESKLQVHLHAITSSRVAMIRTASVIWEPLMWRLKVVWWNNGDLDSTKYSPDASESGGESGLESKKAISKGGSNIEATLEEAVTEHGAGKQARYAEPRRNGCGQRRHEWVGKWWGEYTCQRGGEGPEDEEGDHELHLFVAAIFASCFCFQS